MSKKLLYPLTSLLAAASLALTGCAQQGTPAGFSPSSSDSSAQASASVAVKDSWVKVATSGMSAAFGTIRNTSANDVRIVSASTPTSPMVELHETVMGANGTMQMQAKQGGFVIPAHGELKLEPGANHIMLMGLTQPVQAGDEIVFKLKTSDGATVSFTAQGKDFTGANENYASDGGATPEHGVSGHGSMDHSHAESSTTMPAK